jgi:membrane-associated protein
MFLYDLFHNMPAHLSLWADVYGPGLYLILIVVIFAETGFVVTPFLPGDSLLFAAGAVVAITSADLNIFWMALGLSVAAVAGDALNYQIGHWLAGKQEKYLRWLNPKYLERTREFYAHHGGKTIFLARFVPIVRTYAPFVAGLSGMRYRDFALFNILGGIVWINAFLFLGYLLGNTPGVKENFQYVVLGIVLISVLPILWEFARTKVRRTFW